MSFIGLRHWPRKPWYSTPSRRGLSKIQIRRADGDILTQTTAVSHKINLHCIHNSKRPCYLTVGCTQPTASKRCPCFFMFSMLCCSTSYFNFFMFPSVEAQRKLSLEAFRIATTSSPSTWNRWATSSPGGTKILGGKLEQQKNPLVNEFLVGG